MSARHRFVVTGTDTEVGKTFATCACLAAARHRGLATGAMKPVASGCVLRHGELVSEDAAALAAALGTGIDPATINPYRFAPAIAPHLAAAEAGVAIDTGHLAERARALAAGPDFFLLEGVGGWQVPLDARRTFADLASSLGWPVLLVVAVRLGCINHALLSAASILASGLPLAGWIANHPAPPAPRAAANIRTLCVRLPAPLLGVLPYRRDGDWGRAARRLDLDRLLTPS